MQGELNARIKKNEVAGEYVLLAPFPRNMLLEVTNICNGCCIFCANAKSSRKKRMMDFSFGERILREAYESGTREVGFYATGEPLINMDLEKYVICAKKIGYEYVYITTNGALLDKERSESLVQAGIDSVKFSVNAANAKDYLLIHGKDDFEKVRNNIRSFHEIRKQSSRQINLFLSCILTEYTKDIEESYRALFGDLADDIVFLKCINQGGYMHEINSGLAVGNEGGYHPVDGICPMFFKNLYVTVEGYLTMCCTDFQNYLVVADLNEESLWEAWNNGYAQKLRKAHMEHRLENTLCFNCICNTNKKVEPLIEKYAEAFDYENFDMSAIIHRRIEAWQQETPGRMRS